MIKEMRSNTQFYENYKEFMITKIATIQPDYRGVVDFESYIPKNMCKNDKQFVQQIFDANPYIYEKFYHYFKDTDDMVTYDDVDRICRAQTDIFYKIDDKFKTDSLCKYVLKENGHLLRKVPIEKRTSEICMIALGNTVRAMEDVPTEIIDQSMVDFVFNSFHEKNHTNQVCFLINSTMKYFQRSLWNLCQ